MSTKFTISTATDDLPEPLTILLEAASQSVLKSLIARLRVGGYNDITDPHLVLFGNLDCGATHASQIAQRMQVSRQAISKTLRELQSLGFVRLQDDPARKSQKLVIMTDRGMDLALDARRELGLIEAAIETDIGPQAMACLRRALEKRWGKGATRRLH